MCWNSSHAAPLDRVQSKASCCITSLPLTDNYLLYKFCLSVVFSSIFYQHHHANCSSKLVNCIPPLLMQPCCPWLFTRSLPPWCSLMQELTSTYILSSLLLVSFYTVLCLNFLQPLNLSFSAGSVTTFLKPVFIVSWNSFLQL